MNKPNQQTVREIARTAVSYVTRDQLVQAAMAEHGISHDNVYAWSEIYDAVLDTIAAGVQEPGEATGGEQQPWPRAQRMPLAIAGGRPQPWHQQAIAEYGAVTGTEMEPNPTIPGGYTATQVNSAIRWWNERAELERQLNEQELAWHELRLFSGSHPVDESDVEQHELTHPDQCQTLPPGAACWAERQPFRWWWPTVHGAYRIRPEDLSPLGGDGPDYQMTLRVQVLREGEWFEYTNDIIGPDPTDETPAIAERLKAMIAEKAKQQPADVVTAEQQQDGAVGRVEAIRARWESAGFRALSDGRIDELIKFLLDQLADLPAVIARAESAEGAWSAQQDVIEAERRRAGQEETERTALAARVAELESEREADTRAVLALLKLGEVLYLGQRPTDWADARRQLNARFADRIAALDFDTDGGAE